jgi:thiol-disulfide isomerase/thioredoxin
MNIKKYLPHISIAIILVIAAGFYLDHGRTKGIKLNAINSNSTAQNANAQAAASGNASGKNAASGTLSKASKPAVPADVVDFQNYGPAPDFVGIDNWINSSPLHIQDLKGKVVLVDFWTYSCINCIRTLPFVTGWYDTYKDNGFVVIGVHTPEFSFEKDTANVQDAIKRFKINYPVAQDNSFSTWNAYRNQFWPAEYLIDKNGNLVYMHLGEGNYDHTENAIRSLLGMNTNPLNMVMDQMINNQLGNIGSPEMYFEPQRIANLSPSQNVSLTEQAYSFPPDLALNNFALDGFWKFVNDGAVTTKPGAKIRLKFHSGKLHIVAQSQSPLTLSIVVDGKQQPDVIVNQSELYTLFDSAEYTDHTVEITIPGSGFEAFTFTFG